VETGRATGNPAGRCADRVRPGLPGAWRRPRTLLLLLLALSLWPGAALAGGTEVIVSPDRNGTTINREVLRAIFTTRLRQWPDGTPVRVFVLPDDSTLGDQFYREQLGMYPYVLREIWDRMQFTGTGLAPTLVHSEAEMRNLVQSTPGAIGYVSAHGPHSDNYSAHVAFAGGATRWTTRAGP
jgi:hypothetical protein